MNKFIKFSLLTFISLVLLVGSFSSGFITGHVTSSAGLLSNLPALPGVPRPVSTPENANEATPDELETLFKPFWESWKLVHDLYVDQPVDDTILMRGAIQGMLAALGDEHTSYMDPENYEQSTTALSGSYEGIGAFVDTTADFLTVISPIKDSPASKAG